MPAQSAASEKTSTKPTKRAKGPRARAKSKREAEARREIAALSDRIDRDLALLQAETDRLWTHVMRK